MNSSRSVAGLGINLTIGSSSSILLLSDRDRVLEASRLLTLRRRRSRTTIRAASFTYCSIFTFWCILASCSSFAACYIFGFSVSALSSSSRPTICRIGLWYVAGRQKTSSVCDCGLVLVARYAAISGCRERKEHLIDILTSAYKYVSCLPMLKSQGTYLRWLKPLMSSYTS